MTDGEEEGGGGDAKRQLDQLVGDLVHAIAKMRIQTSSQYCDRT